MLFTISSKLWSRVYYLRMWTSYEVLLELVLGEMCESAAGLLLSPCLSSRSCGAYHHIKSTASFYVKEPCSHGSPCSGGFQGMLFCRLGLQLSATGLYI